MSIVTALSTLLTLAGALGMWLTGRNRWYGWALSLAMQPVWAALFILTGAWALLPTCLLYGAIHARNTRAWWRAAKEQPA